jgi:hypothetical protein
MTIFRFFLLGLFAYILTGCGGGPTPRLLDLLEKDGMSDVMSSRKQHPGSMGWVQASKIGLVVHSDAIAPNAAQPIIPAYLETLTRRTQEFLIQHCDIQEIPVVSPLVNRGNFFRELEGQAHRLQVPYVMVIILSSREKTGPEKLGEATMMTQMSGTVMENSALAEAGILEVPGFNMLFMTSGQATETLEQLDVPIGQNRPLATDARDILRARAGQQALDRALEPVGSDCRHARRG